MRSSGTLEPFSDWTLYERCWGGEERGERTKEEKADRIHTALRQWPQGADLWEHRQLWALYGRRERHQVTQWQGLCWWAGILTYAQPPLAFESLWENPFQLAVVPATFDANYRRTRGGVKRTSLTSVALSLWEQCSGWECTHLGWTAGALPWASPEQQPVLRLDWSSWFYHDGRTYPRKSNQGTLKGQSLLLPDPGGYIQGLTVRSGLARAGRERGEQSWGPAFIEGKCRVSRVSLLHSLLANLKPKSRSLGCR